MKLLSQAGIRAVRASKAGDFDSVVHGSYRIILVSLSHKICMAELQCLFSLNFSVHVSWDCSKCNLEKYLWSAIFQIAPCACRCWWSPSYSWMVGTNSHPGMIAYHIRCCVWSCRGPEFRTVFERIGGLRALTKAPFMALTASDPPTVEEKINSLGLCDPVTVKLQHNRNNVYLRTVRGTGLKVGWIV